MQLFDTHVHLKDLSGPYAREEQLKRAEAVGVTRWIAVGGSCSLNKSAAEAAEAFPGRIRAALGFDRDQVEELSVPAAVEDALGRLRRAVSALRRSGAGVCAIGEIGLDYHYAPGSAVKQIALFEAQCGLAVELGLPVIVHSRQADADTLAVLEAYARQGRRTEIGGVLHCFTGDMAFADRLLDAGFMISFSGIVTFLNADALRAVARRVPADRLLIETDSPYLAPVPHRGMRNEPAFVRAVAEVLARERGEPLAVLAAQTTANAHRLFGVW